MTKANNFTKRKPRATTDTPVSASTEWTDHKGILLLFGLKRPTAYHLVNTEPMLKGASISLRHEDEVRGKRLFNVPQFRRFLDSKREPAKAER